MRFVRRLFILCVLLMTACEQAESTSTAFPQQTAEPPTSAPQSTPHPPTAVPTAQPTPTNTHTPTTPPTKPPSTATNTPTPQPTDTQIQTATFTPTPTEQPIQHVIHISVDGLGGLYLADLLANDDVGDFPTFKRLTEEGAYTFNARTDYDWTVTLPNHTSMLTARPAVQQPDLPLTTHHGYAGNGVPFLGETVHNNGNPNLNYVPSVFDVVHDHGLKTALYATKIKFGLFDTSYNEANGAEDKIGEDNGRDKIDIYDNNWLAGSRSTNLHNRMLESLVAERPHYAFLHYVEPDAFGHAYGWGSDYYYFAVREVDGHLGELLATIENDAVLAQRTVVIITADHGGYEQGHSNASLRSNYTIPVIVWGRDVAAASDLYALNLNTHTDPAETRPTYLDPARPIRSGETGTLALALLNLPPIPDSFMNRAMNVHSVIE